MQEQEGPDDKSVQVGDKSQLDYAAGGEEDEQPAEQEGREQQQQEQQEGTADEQPQPQAGVEEEQEEEELGDYQDRCEVGAAGRVLGRHLHQPSGRCAACMWEPVSWRHGAARQLCGCVTANGGIRQRSWHTRCQQLGKACCPPTAARCPPTSCSPTTLSFRPEDRGHVQPEGAEPDFELPEDLNLDGVEAGDEGEQAEPEEEQVGQWAGASVVV